MALPFPLSAQQGSIGGRITDQQTGEALIGATVLLPGTTLGAVSDVDGHYRITTVAPGTYTLSVRLLGYRDKVITGVRVGEGAATALPIIMEGAASQKLQELVVTSSFRQESVNALYAARKSSAVMTDGLSAEQIRRSPDKNTGEVLRRVSGTSVQDHKFVVIRGLAERYNATLMNDAVMPSSEPDKKAFSTDIVPASLVDQVLIYKTASADRPGDAAGGTVQIMTKDFPDRTFLDLSVGTGFDTRTTLQDFYGGLPRGRYDFLGFDDGSRGLPAAFAAVQNSYASLSTDDKLAITRQFPNTFGSGDGSRSLPPLALQLSGGLTRRSANGHQFGLTGALSYGSSRRASFGERAQYLLSREQLYALEDHQYSRDYHGGGLLNLSYSFGRNKLSLKNFFNNEFSGIFMQRSGRIFDGTGNTTDVFSVNNESRQNGLFNTVLEGKHALGARPLEINWNLAYGRSYRLQPDQRILTVSRPLSSGGYVLRLSNQNSPAVKDAGRVYSRLHENIYSGQLHFALPFRLLGQTQRFRFGGSKTYRSRDFHVLALGYASELDPYGRGASIPVQKGDDFSDLLSAENLDQYKVLLANIPQNTKDYTGTADLNAGFLLLDTHLSPQWHLAWGVRLEDYTQRLRSVNQAAQEYHNTDLLPSANLIWSPQRRMQLRAAYSRTLNRPEFRELAAFRYYDYENNFIISGNPSLRRSVNDNMDLRWEYYPGPGEILSATLFYKFFRDPIEQTNQGNNVLAYNNADNAEDYGAELEIRKRMNFSGWPSWLHDMILQANATFIRGQVSFAGQQHGRPLQGQSPYLINGGISYAPEGNDFSVSLLYNRTGQRLRFRGENEGLDTYEKARDLLDLQLSKKCLHEAGEFRLSISDLLAQPLVWYTKYSSGSKTGYQPGEDMVISSVRTGTRISLSFRYRLYQEGR